VVKVLGDSHDGRSFLERKSVRTDHQQVLVDQAGHHQSPGAGTNAAWASMFRFKLRGGNGADAPGDSRP
jgi:hypothetical protein